MSVMVPSPIAGIFAPLASTKFMACFPHCEAPARAGNSRGQTAQSRSGHKLRRLLDAPPARGGYWMPRFRGAGQPYFRRRQVLRTRFATQRLEQFNNTTLASWPAKPFISSERSLDG